MSASRVIWGTWGVLFAAGVVFVSVYGRNCPYMDEWAMLPTLVGDVDPLGWAWEAHGEHRYPLGRLVFLGLFRAFGDLRAAMFLSLILLAATSAQLIRTARQFRGRTSFADAFFPLAFLHAGHWENLLMSYQVCFTLTVALMAVFVSVAATGARTRRDTAAVLAVVALPLCGAAGLPFGVSGAAWLFWISIPERRRNFGRAAVAMVGAVVTTLLILVIVVTHAGPANSPPRTVEALLGFFARLTGATFGPAAEILWPVFATGMLVIAAAIAWRASTLWRSPQRTEVIGFSAVFVAGLGLALGLTWGRAWTGPEAAFTSRYSILMAMTGAAVFLACVRIGTPRVAKAGPAVMAAFALAAWPLNLAAGVSNASRINEHVDGIAADYRDGLPASLIGERYDWQLLVNHPWIALDLDNAARLGFPPFRQRNEVRTVTSIPLAASPDTRSLDLPFVPDLLAVRVRGKFVPSTVGMADYRVRWQDADSGQWHEERFQVVRIIPFAVVIRVSGTPLRVEIRPDRGPDDYEVIGVDLVVGQRAESSSTASAGSR